MANDKLSAGVATAQKCHSLLHNWHSVGKRQVGWE